MSRGAEGICVELVYDSECPNVNQARTNLAHAVQRLGLATGWKEWRSDDPNIPAHARRRASPTILVNGHDIVESDLIDGTSSCRVYTGPDGLLGAPSAEEIVDAINASDARSCSL